MPFISTLHRGVPVLAACLAALTLGSTEAASPTAAEAIAVEPRQKGVDYDRPARDEAASATIKQEKLEGVSALVVRAADGRVLRAFADTDGDRVVDRWSFFKDGLEVYREMDGDDTDTKADQSRWLNSAGSRWGVDTDGDGAIDAWKVLSAEETTAEIVRALADRDAAAFARLLPTKADLEAAGFDAARSEELAARAGDARRAFAAIAVAQKQVGPKAAWTSMLTPQPPGVLPAGSPGVARDVTAYDNVVALADEAGAGVQVIVGSLVRCGDAWRPIDAPQLPGPDGRLAESQGFFTPGAPPGAAGQAVAADEASRPLLAALRQLEERMVAADAAGRRGLAGEHIAKLGEIAAAAGEAERPFWNRQLVETAAAYVQEGLLPDGMAVLEKLAERTADDPELSALVGLRVIQARYAASMEAPGADPQKLQDEWFASLAKFVEDHPRAPEAAEALLQLALRDEFEGRDAEAVARYGEITSGFPGTPQARKAAGAVRRLESVGKPLTLSGTTLDGKRAAVEGFRGRPVLVHFWSTDCEPCKVDLAQIRELHAKYGPQRFACVGVAVDGDRAKLVKFLAGKPLPWPQLHEEGGLDGRLAEELGVQALPTMILLDAEGKVVDRNVSITGLERKLEALLGGQ